MIPVDEVKDKTTYSEETRVTLQNSKAFHPIVVKTFHPKPEILFYLWFTLREIL